MSKKDATDLLNRYRNGEVSEEEKALVESWYAAYTQNAATPKIDDQELEKNRDEILRRVLSDVSGTRKINFGRLISIAALAILILCASVLFIKYRTPHQGQPSYAVKKGNTNIPPGGNRATLILSNGSTINLNDTKNGALANEKGVVIHKNADGRITYDESSHNATPGANVFNTVITPKGGQYQLVLGDGTKVWLNAASTLKYPVTFSGIKREIELSGEAYFEVAHDQHKPFLVISNGQTVEVLGTHFNVNAYPDEKMTRTTLLEGSVKVSAGEMTSKIRPGQQVQFKDGHLAIAQADIEEAIAWKKGFFYFKDDDIQTVMRQLSRWYDVVVKYEGQIPTREFSGQMNKNINASQLMHILSIEQIHYRIEGRTIIIMP
ncbi:FecR family protein [Mucilaginibacter sp. SG564]|uniref:FecR family protein n=1 Tax=Mucilaginibacter sp. SG564 TaxID=2587022 RepID=UPI0015525947|nr:FecR family protein [Mucilaginibacter sp. SG564]NOW98047.1 ferric-dicitrate binding protein FerR (iron transport regulator) [Mucilaginibacter sp. SG564]